jgi:hypothetical protein
MDALFMASLAELPVDLTVMLRVAETEPDTIRQDNTVKRITSVLLNEADMLRVAETEPDTLLINILLLTKRNKTHFKKLTSPFS